jgi:phthalate 4,5-cis-dihydrodiol dehydrogenase
VRAVTVGAISVGIVGLGRATQMMLPALGACPGVRVVAGADPRLQARETFENVFGGMAYADADGLCADPRVQAVIVATPPRFHCDIAVTAARAGKHVLVEKPMATSVAECDEMIDAAERNGVHLVVGHSLAYSPAVRAIAQAVGTGEFGPLGSILSCFYTDYLYRPRAPEELQPGIGSGVFLNQLPHVIDCLRLIAGGVIESVAAASAWVWDESRPVPGAASAFLRLRDGASATLVYSGYDRFDSREWTYGLDEMGRSTPLRHGVSSRARSNTAGRADEAGLLDSVRFGGPEWSGASEEERQPQPGALLVSCRDADLRPSPDGVTVYSAQGLVQRPIRQIVSPAGRVEVLEELYRAVADDEASVFDGHWGKATVEACLAIQQSATQGGPVELRHQRAVPVPTQSPVHYLTDDVQMYGGKA